MIKILTFAIIIFTAFCFGGIAAAVEDYIPVDYCNFTGYDVR
jgi:hypothetical protein